ncbi:MAG: hypothetical protein RL206_402 [Bacteroidota bacterium]|jgi:hypothetical protein
MKTLVTSLLLALAFAAGAQTRLPNGSVQDLTLELGVRAEAIKQSGILRLCVAKEGQCIENLTLGFTVRVYDVKGVEVWNSMWTGRSLDLKFKKPVPTAHKVVVEATSAQVVNKLTGNPISTGKPLKLEFVVE